MVLTAHMGVAFSKGLSKNSSWSDPDAVIPVMKVCNGFICEIYFPQEVINLGILMSCVAFRCPWKSSGRPQCRPFHGVWYPPSSTRDAGALQGSGRAWWR